MSSAHFSFDHAEECHTRIGECVRVVSLRAVLACRSAEPTVGKCIPYWDQSFVFAKARLPRAKHLRVQRSFILCDGSSRPSTVAPQRKWPFLVWQRRRTELKKLGARVDPILPYSRSQVQTVSLRQHFRSARS